MAFTFFGSDADSIACTADPFADKSWKALEDRLAWRADRRSRWGGHAAIPISNPFPSWMTTRWRRRCGQSWGFDGASMLYSLPDMTMVPGDFLPK